MGEELVERLCELHMRMLNAIQSQRPYPVKQEIGKADSDTILGAAVFIERALATPLAELQAEVERKDAALRDIAGSNVPLATFLAVEGRWQDFTNRLQEIARAALRPPSGKEATDE